MLTGSDMLTDQSGSSLGYSSWPLRNGYTGVTSSQLPHSSETMMRFYNQQHRFYCGVDLHARTLSLCILDADGTTVFHDTIAASPDAFLKAVHGGKAKTDKIDAKKIAVLFRGGMLPQAYVYPKGMRETRDLLRRRTYLVRKRAEALVHLQNTNSQYNLPPFPKKLAYAANRAELNIPARFSDPSVRKNVG